MAKILLKDYKPSEYKINHTDLKVALDAEKTTVTANLFMEKQNADAAPLLLHGGDFKLISISLDGVPLTENDYTIVDNNLILNRTTPDNFVITTVSDINPSANTALEGLYKTDDILTTHCEAEGFRNITYYLDRPDVLATITTEIHADKTQFPVLLSNGNLVDKGDCADDPTRHFALYNDPIPKPSYLFALVAGNLALRQDFFVTRSGKRITLNIYVPEADLDKTAHAMEALKAAMKFDEDHYDREYDLEVYNIVGVPQFNAGAMENKGLNIFNTSALFAHPEQSTDKEFEWVYSVVGHEYFHNHRGNRVTVKNWFQLSLKEGFATVTEQEFAQLLLQSKVSRIGDIQALQARQFKDDAGPLAHPVMPTEYEVPDNLYTTTIYKKGAELLNMIRTLLGPEHYKAGCSIYFAQHDGQAANIEDFLAAMEQASGRDLSQFLIWYQQAGTPQLAVEANYDPQSKTYQLTFTQSCPPTPGQPDKKPLLIPISLGLINSAGQDMELWLQGETAPRGTQCVLELTAPQQTFTFTNVAEQPTPSLLRNFSAPVKITKTPVTHADNLFLLKHDSDPVNRWFASQNLAHQAISQLILAMQNGDEPLVDPVVIESFRAVLQDTDLEPRLAAELLSFPSEESLFDGRTAVDPALIHRAHRFFVDHFIEVCYLDLAAAYQRLPTPPAETTFNPHSAGLRALKNRCLSYLTRSAKPEAIDWCITQLHQAGNMTDTLGALAPLAIFHRDELVSLRQQELDNFCRKWQNNPLVLQHAFNLYALSEAPDALDQIITLTQNPLFDITIPNHVRALVLRFYTANADKFHEPSGRGYQFVADFLIQVDKINPSTAATLAPAFVNWKIIEPQRQAKMLEQLNRLLAIPELSQNVKEILNKALPQPLKLSQGPVFFQPADEAPVAGSSNAVVPPPHLPPPF